MKQIYTDLIILALSVGMVVIGCSKSVVVDYNERMFPKVDTSTYTPRTITRADTTEAPDTSRVPISFGVTVDGWGDENDVNF